MCKVVSLITDSFLKRVQNDAGCLFRCLRWRNWWTLTQNAFNEYKKMLLVRPCKSNYVSVCLQGKDRDPGKKFFFTSPNIPLPRICHLSLLRREIIHLRQLLRCTNTVCQPAVYCRLYRLNKLCLLMFHLMGITTVKLLLSIYVNSMMNIKTPFKRRFLGLHITIF